MWEVDGGSRARFEVATYQGQSSCCSTRRAEAFSMKILTWNIASASIVHSTRLADADDRPSVPERRENASTIPSVRLPGQPLLSSDLTCTVGTRSRHGPPSSVNSMRILFVSKARPPHSLAQLRIRNRHSCRGQDDSRPGNP
jgi:hypothetical protein